MGLTHDTGEQPLSRRRRYPTKTQISAVDRTTIIRGKLRVLLWGRDHSTHDSMWEMLIDGTLEIADRNADEGNAERSWARSNGSNEYSYANRRKAVASTVGAIMLNEDRQSKHWVLDAIEEAMVNVSMRFTGEPVAKAKWMLDRGSLPEYLVSSLEVAMNGTLEAFMSQDDDLVLEHLGMMEMIIARLKERT
jgi:hypothetical protein